MIRLRSGVVVAFVAITILGFATADEATYQKAFVSKVVQFANLNRLNISRLHRDVHADCYIPVTIATVILSDGSVKDISIVTSSSVPIVDRYFRYVIEQAAPFAPLSAHIDPAPDEFTVTHEFRLDARLWSDGQRSTRACKKLTRPAAE
jgi:hypothetical protein